MYNSRIIIYNKEINGDWRSITILFGLIHPEMQRKLFFLVTLTFTKEKHDSPPPFLRISGVFKLVEFQGYGNWKNVTKRNNFYLSLPYK